MNASRRVLYCCLACGVVVSPRSATAERLPDSGVVYDRATAASVEILIGGHQSGSGWFVDGEGRIVTAAHVVGKSKQPIEALSSSLGRVPVQVVAWDVGHDLVMLQAQELKAESPHLPTADRMPSPGETVYLFASPMYRHQVMIRGAVSRPTPTFEYLSDQGHYIEAYHVSAPSPPGTSGGCWLDAMGRVVGCQSAFVSKGEVGMGIALVTGPGPIARLVQARRSIATCTVGAGFEELWSQPAGFIARFPRGAAGLVPVLPIKGGPAERAGLVGDILIIAVDGRSVQYRDPLLRAVRAKRPGDVVTFTVLSPDGGQTRKIPVQLAELRPPRPASGH